MADKIKYNWVINALDAKIKEDDQDNVIFNIHWSYNAEKGDYKSNMIGTYSVEYDKDNFIKYDDLQKSDIESWLEAGLDVDSMKQNLSDQLSMLANPTDVVLRPNW